MDRLVSYKAVARTNVGPARGGEIFGNRRLRIAQKPLRLKALRTGRLAGGFAKLPRRRGLTGAAEADRLKGCPERGGETDDAAGRVKPAGCE